MEINVKTGVLWEPENLGKNKPFFSLLTITMKNGFPLYREDILNRANIERLQGQWSPSMADMLQSIGMEERVKGEARIMHQQQKMGSSQKASSFFLQAIEKLHYRHIQLLMQKAVSLRLYHRVVNDKTGRPMVAPCHFMATVPRLSFRLSGRPQQVFLQALLTVEGETLPLDKLKRYHFMLRRDSNWYMLDEKDAHILDKLEKLHPENYATDLTAFSGKILSLLEDSYVVDKKGILPEKDIRVQPQNCIYFAELSGSFLMLTPRWQYEGFSVEGEWKETEEKKQRGITYLIHRDKETEAAFTQYIQSLHPDFSGQASRGFYFLSFANAKKRQWFIHAYRNLLKNNVEVLGLDMLQHFRYSPFEADTEIRILKKSPSRLDLHVKVRFGKEEVALNSIQKMLLSGQRNVLLKDDSIGAFSDEWMTRYALLFKHGVVYQNRLTIPPWLLLGEAATLQPTETDPDKDPNGLPQTLVNEAIPAEWQQKWLRWQKQEPVVALPSSIHTVLRPYQQKGFEWLVLLSDIGAGACLADDMGLGKTLQAICFLAFRKEKSARAAFLVVCPASLLYNWKQELERFAPSLTAFVYNGPARNFDRFAEEKASVFITSYSTLRQDIGLLKEKDWDTVVLDESQNIKNPSAQVTKAVYELEVHNHIALSGTPVMNNTFDLYSQLNFLLPGLLGNREFFKKEYALPIDRDGNAEKTAALRSLTGPFILRRTKKQVASDLPEKTESILWCEMGEEQRDFYEEVKADIQSSLFLGIRSEGIAKSRLNILQGILKLRQVCDTPELIKEGDYTPCTSSIKIERLVEELEHLSDNGSKALVFSQYKGMLESIAAHCDQAGITYFHFDGSTPLPERNALVQSFQAEDSRVSAFLISLKSGNAGLNLTAADYVFLVDPWWNNAVEQQAIDRTHRIGQTKNVFAYKMVCRGTIEEKIIALQQKKKQISDGLVMAEEGLVKNMTEEDLKYLFS